MVIDAVLNSNLYTNVQQIITLSLKEPLFFMPFVLTSDLYTYFHVIITLSLREPLVLMLTVINCGLQENKSFVSHVFCPNITDLKLLTSTP